MKIQKISDQSLREKKLPPKVVIIQLLDEDSKHLAFIACQHKQIFSLFDSGNDREQSHFLEEISNFEAEILQAYFRLDGEMEKKFGGFTGEFMITDKNADIIYHSKPFPSKYDVDLRTKDESREKFLQALSKVPKVEPVEEDRID
jgi:hypothetical protein